MNTHQPHRPRDDDFAAAYTALVDDLTTVLDLAAGADDATHPATYDALTADLATALRLDAGLTDIIGDHTAPAPQVIGPVPTTTGTPTTRRLTNHLESLTDVERLVLQR